jgi:hypothetical protein
MPAPITATEMGLLDVVMRVPFESDQREKGEATRGWWM